MTPTLVAMSNSPYAKAFFSCEGACDAAGVSCDGEHWVEAFYLGASDTVTLRLETGEQLSMGRDEWVALMRACEVMARTIIKHVSGVSDNAGPSGAEQMSDKTEAEQSAPSLGWSDESSSDTSPKEATSGQAPHPSML